jgi:A1 cistron-splicing factor AAR2
VCAGFLQWKALLALLFACDDAALQTHTPLFVAFLQVVSAQLSFALSTEGNNDEALVGMEAVFGESLTDYLNDSFLRDSAQGFFGSLMEADKVPQDLWHQVRAHLAWFVSAHRKVLAYQQLLMRTDGLC